MKHFNTLKKKIRNNNTELPDDFSWENMESGIFEKMNDLNHRENSDKKIVPYKMFWLLAIISLIGVTIIYQINQSKFTENKITESKDIANHSSDTHKSLVEESSNVINQPKEESKKQITIDSDIKNNLERSNTLLQKKNETNNVNYSQANTDLNESSTRSKDQLSSNNNNTSSNGKIEAVSNVMDEKNNNEEVASMIDHLIPNPQSTTKISQKLNNESEKEKDQISKKKIRTLLQMEAVNTSVVQNVFSLNNTIPQIDLAFTNVSSLQEDELKIKSKKWSISLGSALINWDQNVDNNPSFEDINTLLSNSQSLSTEYFVNKNWSISGGLEKRNLWSKLNTQTVNEVQRDVENTAVQYLVYAFDNSRDTVYGTATVIDTSTRSVVHHNKVSQLSIPLLMNYTKTFNRFDVGLGLGFDFIIKSKSEGRFRENTDIVDYQTDEKSPYSSSFQSSLLTSLRLRYHLSDYFYVGTGLSYSKSLSNWSADEAVTFKPSWISGRISLGYKF